MNMKLTDYQMGILSAATHHGGAVRGVPDYKPEEIGPLMASGLIYLSEDKTRWLATPEGRAELFKEIPDASPRTL